MAIFIDLAALFGHFYTVFSPQRRDRKSLESKEVDMKRRPSMGIRRPKKKPRDRRRREREHQNRLLGLGVSLEEQRTMNAGEVRAAIRKLEKAAARA